MNAAAPRILIAGIGNIFLGDDGFGCEVIRQRLRHAYPENIRITDFGIRGMDLTYALLENHDAAILIDAVPRGSAPGTLYVIEPEMPSEAPELSPESPLIDMHAMDPVKVLRLVIAMGGRLDRLLLLGCEPAPFSPEDANDEMAMGLSPAVERAIPEAVTLLDSLIKKITAEFTGSPATCSPGDPTIDRSLKEV